ncbi:hypothetical protein FB554_0199 [Barrientosiimonas humi]|uniref:Uncharacterized protein n=1 Tax=Barrientosiimonas humi TaxID=999931 RepID=A0A542X8D9_9MICO|nr:hypothetical protein [Barrientosiimonas humi]TQL32084.1 hypothetical protein FB554_0199 [Barrientosiimonas humi]CAG7572058.1 hypothetical protein BH39T_PBIAJDOK_00683 [Barrientosiimonas humi]
MTGWRLYLAARGTVAAIAVSVGALLLVLASGVTVFEVRLVATEIPRFTPVWELVPVLLAAALPALLVSRLASWEHTQHRRLRTRAATVAVAAVTIPASIPWVAQFRLPDDARWVDITCNVALFAAVALVATCVFGRLAGPAVALMAYVGTIGVQQLSPALAARLPVSGARTNLQPHPWPTLVVVLVAVAAWTLTLGRSRWTARRTRHD